MSDLETKPVATAAATIEETKVCIKTTEQPAPAVALNDEDIPAADEEGDIQKDASEDKKEPEPPKDPKEDPIGWLGSLIPAAVHKVNYQVLEWAQELAIDEEDKRQTLPGKNDAVTKSQFLTFLRDGSLLAKLANRLHPGAIETVHEGDAAKDKTHQTDNINAFINFAKEKAGLTDEQVFTVEDLQNKGKAGYESVFGTLMQLGTNVQHKFEQKGIDTDQLVQVASQAVQTNLLQTILNFFRRARPAQQSEKQLAKEAEEKEKADKMTNAEKVVEEKVGTVEEECKKVDAQAAADAVPIPAH